MRENKSSIVFRQMEDPTESVIIGFAFLLGGLLFFVCGLYMVCTASYVGCIACVFGIVFMRFGFSPMQCHFTHVKITQDEVSLKLGPFTLNRMAVSDVRTLGYGEVWLQGIRGDPKGVEENTRIGIIVLSPQTSSGIRLAARRWVSEEIVQQTFASEEDKEYAIMQSAFDAYIGQNISNFRIEKGEGVWLEYSPERLRIIKELMPMAEDYVTDR